jgi:uncharacterized protein (DUF736 family)
MATIGTFKLIENGRFEGPLGTLTVRARVSNVPVSAKTTDDQPDYRVTPAASSSAPGGASPATAATTMSAWCSTTRALPPRSTPP